MPEASARSVRYRPMGPATFYLLHGLLALLVVMAAAGLVSAALGGDVDPSFAWGMPAFALVFGVLVRWSARPVVVDVPDGRTLRIVRPFALLPSRASSIPLEGIVSVHVEERSGGPDAPEESRIVIRRLHAEDVAVSGWTTSGSARLRPVAQEIEALVRRAT